MFEVLVQSSSGNIRGYIDWIHKSNDSVTLRDYKTGQIAELAPDHKELRVKKAYQDQLKMYAALYASNYGDWPAGLELVPLSGPAMPIPFTTSECSALLDSAELDLQRIDSIAMECSREPEEAERRLATAAAGTCRFCQFRPACSNYHRTRGRDRIMNHLWPCDSWGELREKTLQANGRVSLSIQATYPTPELNRIRNLTSDVRRHPAMNLMKPGERVAAYNLKLEAGTHMYTESPFTVLYHMAGESDVKL
jgi:hypothetical protein